MGATLPGDKAITDTEALAMTVMKLSAAIKCSQLIDSNRAYLLAEAEALALPLTPQLEDNKDDE